jgi:hypothetical protein
LSQDSPLFGKGKRTIHPVLPDVKELIPEVITFPKVLRGSGGHFELQLEIECVEKIGLCLEVGEE